MDILCLVSMKVGQPFTLEMSAVEECEVCLPEDGLLVCLAHDFHIVSNASSASSLIKLVPLRLVLHHKVFPVPPDIW